MTYANEIIRTGQGTGKIQLYLLHWQIRSTMTAVGTHALRPTSSFVFVFMFSVQFLRCSVVWLQKKVKYTSG